MHCAMTSAVAFSEKRDFIPYKGINLLMVLIYSRSKAICQYGFWYGAFIDKNKNQFEQRYATKTSPPPCLT